MNVAARGNDPQFPDIAKVSMICQSNLHDKRRIELAVLNG
jgi:hypothetical protein